ncbi:MAG: bile acid:sodium symporter family protein [Planctomycetes bacterium]|nr:bile acid:sodium symporter family protein [Planctomycetota bacterium]MCH9725214.1 bile acid:sodium symporter family protein [Planctomycetota bacterium]MCH9778998.1 bile acid:sodium symporter family protein [Planctomycetota bacterium]MCH9791361.1 bile acid:sodium symporter family protein [Planctomycetota bacterium]MDF1746197.1 bile acid:sodium symporter family protein [Gimesia sp.]
MLQRFLLFWLILLSALAVYWDQIFSGGVDPFKDSEPFLPYLFALTMLVIGALLPAHEIREVFRRWHSVLAGTFVQYTVMPGLAFLVSLFFLDQPQLRIGIILVGCVPGAMASNVLTLAARGNVSYSVCLTTSATLLSPLFVPLFLYLAASGTDIDAIELAKDSFVKLLTQVVLPVILGHLFSRMHHGFSRVIQLLGPTFANLSILWIIATIVGKNEERLQNVFLSLAVALLVINLLGYLFGYLAGMVIRLDEARRRALTLEVGMQNAGLGAVLAGQLFPGRELIALPPALYMFGCMLTGTILVQIWAARKREYRIPTDECE